jgi:hypothetical protein
MTLCTVGFDDLVTSFVATVAAGWSDPCRVGLSPTERPRLSRRTQFAAYVMLQFGGDRAHRLVQGAAYSYRGFISSYKDSKDSRR